MSPSPLESPRSFDPNAPAPDSPGDSMDARNSAWRAGWLEGYETARAMRVEGEARRDWTGAALGFLAGLMAGLLVAMGLGWLTGGPK